MALKVRWTPLALSNLSSAFDFISNDKPEIAKAIIAKIMNSLQQLETFPESGREGQVKDTRELIVSTTPYIVVYRLKKEQLEILAILHTSRKWP